MIRQAISCDICGSEKRQTNHWFVVYDQGGELRVAGWSSRNRLRPGSKHLCGQTCLHKLVDEFMAKAISGRAQAGADELEAPDSDRAAEESFERYEEAAAARGGARVPDRKARNAARISPAVPVPTESDPDVLDGYVAAGPIYGDEVSSARLIKPAPAAAPRSLPFRTQPELVPQTGRVPIYPEPAHPASRSDSSAAAAADPSPRFSSRQWRAEAWNRERNRELRNGKTDASVLVRRRAGS